MLDGSSVGEMYGGGGECQQLYEKPSNVLFVSSSPFRSVDVDLAATRGRGIRPVGATDAARRTVVLTPKRPSELYRGVVSL